MPITKNENLDLFHDGLAKAILKHVKTINPMDLLDNKPVNMNFVVKKIAKPSAAQMKGVFFSKCCIGVWDETTKTCWQLCIDGCK